MDPGGGLTCATRISSVAKQPAVRILIELRFVRQWQQKLFEFFRNGHLMIMIFL